jgi:hypothetical protein
MTADPRAWVTKRMGLIAVLLSFAGGVLAASRSFLWPLAFICAGAAGWVGGIIDDVKKDGGAP